MRTTLDIDDAVLVAARALAAQQGISLGAAVSEPARRGLSTPPVRRRRGFPVFPAPDSDHAITDDLVARYRDDE